MHYCRAREVREQADVDHKFTLKDYVLLFKETWVQMICVFVVFFVTLAVFPAVVSNVRLYPTGRKYDFFLPENLYVPVTTFLNFNVFATIGNVAANFVQWPDMDGLIYPVLLRVLFIPFFLFCNYSTATGGRVITVLFQSEYLFITMLALMSFTHGYFSSLGMMYAPRATSDQSSTRFAGMMSAFFLVLGIACGVAFTFLEAYIFL